MLLPLWHLLSQVFEDESLVLGRLDHSLILVASLLCCVALRICDSRHTGGRIKRLLSALFVSGGEESLNRAVSELHDLSIGHRDHYRAIIQLLDGLPSAIRFDDGLDL